MGRTKTGNAPGRASAFSGEKREWLEGFEQDFRTQPRGSFYDDISKNFLTRYGYDLPVEENIPGKIEDWTPVNRKAGLTGLELKEELDFQDDALKKLRVKLSNWFRHRFTGKRLHKGALHGILHAMNGMSGNAARPRRKSYLAHYSAIHYATRLRDDFNVQWGKVKATIHPDFRMSHCQEYVKSRWEAETAEFRLALEKEVDDEHDAAMKKYRETRPVVEASAESYHLALKSFDEVGIPLADALAERLGMHVAILAVGPVGKQKGEVRLRSVFSDTSGGATSKVWGQFDRAGFTAAEASLTRYGRAFFTKDQCRARALPDDGGEDAAPDLSGLLQMPEQQQPVPAAPPPPPPTAPPPPPPAGGATPPAHDGTLEHTTPPLLRAATPSSPTSNVDQWGWSTHLIELYGYMAGKNWGPRWKELLDAVVAFEKAEMWADERLSAVERPDEVGQWMKEHRKSGDYPVGENFGKELLAWWRASGPVVRRRPRPDDLVAGAEWPPKEKLGSWPVWCGVRRAGPNGMMLLVRAFTWWGQAISNAGAGNGLGGGEAALAEHAEWQYLLGDLIWGYGEMTDDLDPELIAELEEERLEALAEKTQGKKGKRGSGKKLAPAKKAAPARQVSGKRGKAAKKKEGEGVTRAAKRKRGNDDEGTEEAMPAKITRSGGSESARPRPRPLPRRSAVSENGGGVEETATDASRAAASANEDAEMSPPDAAGSKSPLGTATASASPPEPIVAETPVVTANAEGPTKPTEETGSRDEDEDPFFEPFKDNPTAGMTEEERKDYEAEMALDGDADEDEDEDDAGDDGED